MAQIIDERAKMIGAVLSVVLCHPDPVDRDTRFELVSTKHVALKRSLLDMLNTSTTSRDQEKQTVKSKAEDVSADQVKRLVRREVDEECEKLQLCMLHAKSRHSFFYAFEQYFVNKENAKLWDHRARSVAQCQSRFGNCYR